MNRLGSVDFACDIQDVFVGAPRADAFHSRASALINLQRSENLQSSVPAGVISNQRLNKNAELLISAHIRS